MKSTYYRRSSKTYLEVLALGKLVIFLCVFVISSGAALGGEFFFRDKVIRIMVGFSPGGGFDINSRILARHMGKHVPGNPDFLVENRTGAGSLVAANYLYKRVAPDGLTIGNFAGGLVMNQIFGKPGVQFDAKKFQYVGVPARTFVVCALTRKSGITSIEEWMSAKEPVKLGGLAPGNETDDVPKILREAIGLPLTVIAGYRGTSRIRLAAERGEVAGGCWNWASISSTWQNALESGKVVVVLQATTVSHPKLKNVPLAIDLAKTEEGRSLIEAGIEARSQILRIYALPPATPAKRVGILRRAYLQTMKDPDFIAEMKKSRQPIDPVPGEKVDAIVNGLFSIDAAVLAKLKGILQ